MTAPEPAQGSSGGPGVVRMLGAFMGMVALGLALFVGLLAIVLLVVTTVFGTDEGTEDNPDGTGIVNNRPGPIPAGSELVQLWSFREQRP